MSTGADTSERFVPTPAEIDRYRWYHTLELPGGIQTPGEYDLRAVLDRVPLPSSLAGKRCLDVGTHDGFWAFEMERRGAKQVIAIDLEEPDRYDWPQPAPQLSMETRAQLSERRKAFELAHRSLGSMVERRDVSVYDLDAELVGEFDFAIIGTLLLHLRDPAGALMAIRRVLHGQLLVNDAVSPSLSFLRPRTPAAEFIGLEGEPFWWLGNVAAQRRLVTSAGYEILAAGGPYLVRTGKGFRRTPLLSRRQFWLTRRLLTFRSGIPHAWVLATPR